jgi:hypothetical protein
MNYHKFTQQGTQNILPVSMLSFTMQLPVSSTASQAMTQPCGGMIITSPGTKWLAEMSMQAEIQHSPLHTIVKFQRKLPLRKRYEQEDTTLSSD